MAMHSPNTLMMLERFNTIRRQILRIKRKAKTADLGMNVKEDLQEALTRLHCARRNMKAYFSERNSASRRRVRSHHQVNGNRPIEDFQEDDDEDVVDEYGYAVKVDKKAAAEDQIHVDNVEAPRGYRPALGFPRERENVVVASA